MNSIITVSSTAQLKSAINSAIGGETIRVADGNYGSVDITKDFASKVTIEAVNKHGAVFETIDFTGGSNVHLDGVRLVQSTLAKNGVEDLTFTNNKFDNGLIFFGGDGIIIDNNDIANGYHTLILDDVTNFELTNNDIHDATSDLVRITGGAKNGLIENNTIRDPAASYPDHPDLVQMFGNANGTPSNLIFRGNLLYDDPNTGNEWGQGFFFSDPRAGGYKNILIEDNLVSVGSPNSIYISGGQENVQILNNSLIPWPSGSGATIRLTDKHSYDNSGVTVDGNVALRLLDETRSSNIGDNFFYQGVASPGQLFSGDGDVWQDFLPKDGSVIDFGSSYGAQDRLNELLGNAPSSDNGGTSNPAPPPPAPTDDPEPIVVEPPVNNAPPPGEGDMVYENLGTTTFNGGTGNVIQLAHSVAFAVEAATIAFSFNAESVNNLQGLFSKDASGNAGGHHLTAYIQNGDLLIRFQNDTSSRVVTIDGISAGKDYDLVISFGGGVATVILDRQTVATEAFDMDWLTNTQYLQIGANGWASASGASGYVAPFVGKMSDIVIVEGVVSAERIGEIQSGELVADTPTPPVEEEPATGDDTPPVEDEPAAGDDTPPVEDEPAAGDDTPPVEDEPVAGDDTPPIEDEPAAGDDTPPIDDPSTGSDTPIAPPLPIIPSVVYTLPGDRVFAGNGQGVIEQAHTSEFDLESATLALTFNTQLGSGAQGIISKDASGYGGGDHVVVYLQGSTLRVRFQDSDAEKDVVFSKSGIDPNRDYDLQISFGEGVVSVWLDGKAIGAAPLDFDWTDNQQYLQIGANGWSSGSGVDGFIQPFRGIISDVVVIEGIVDADEVADIQEQLFAASDSGLVVEAVLPDDGIVGSNAGDLLVGDVASDNIFGVGGNDSLYGGKGGDSLVGGAGDDVIFGLRGKDIISGGAGDDLLVGGIGDDAVYGEVGNDMLKGAGGSDKLYGGSGNDTLEGGSNFDKLTGGDGADDFVFELGNNSNLIKDFESGIDKIVIKSGAGSFNDLDISNRAGDAFVKVGDYTVRLDSVDQSEIDADDFLFG